METRRKLSVAKIEAQTDRELPVVLESRPLAISEEFESRRLIEEKIIEALMDENVNTIGICGVGGIGKTRMVRRIGEKVKGEKLFKFVVMVRVGPSSDLKRILYEISDYLGVRVEVGNFVATANELLSRLIKEERILIILDDVRGILDLEKIGIPLQNHQGSCKIMITSRLESVCLGMGAHKIFTVQGLAKEEMWIILREKAGNSIYSSGLYPLARFVVEKCKGLPLNLSFAGRILKDMSKLWPGIVAEAKLNRALSYESQPRREMVTRGSFYLEREVVDVLKAETINSSVEILEKGIKLKQRPERGQKSWWSSLPPKRGNIKLKIFEDMKSSLSTLPKRGKIEV